MASLYKNYDNVIYEICNEPNNVSWSEIKKYAEEVIPAIRAIDKDAIIIVGTPTWSQDVDVVANDPIKGHKNIMYALHFYTATHKQALRNKATAALNKGLPLFVSEFGVCSADGNGSYDLGEANSWMNFLNSHNISYCVWNLSNKAEKSALISSNVGTYSGWTISQLTEGGKWFVNMMTKGVGK